jgi:hypothetical protein
MLTRMRLSRHLDRPHGCCSRSSCTYARSLSIQHDLHMRWRSPSNTISTATMNSMFTAAAGVFSQDGAPSQPLNPVVLLLHSGGLNDPQDTEAMALPGSWK